MSVVRRPGGARPRGGEGEGGYIRRVLAAVLASLLPFGAANQDSMDPGWPNVLVAMFVVIVVGAAAATVVVYRRARASVRDGRRERQ
jgi:hypothetical protein